MCDAKHASDDLDLSLEMTAGFILMTAYNFSISAESSHINSAFKWNANVLP